MSTLRDRLPIFLTGFAVGTLIAVWLFIRVARESVPMSPEEAITVERMTVPDRLSLGAVPEGWEPLRAFRETIVGDGDREVVWLRDVDGTILRMQRDWENRSAGESSGWELVRADRLAVVSKPRIDPKVMRDGFAHTGYPVVEESPGGVYVVEVAIFPDDAIARARYFLIGRERFVAEVRFVPWAPESVDTVPSGE